MGNSLETERNSKYREALQNEYTGCLFDIDGTLTIWGEEAIPAFAHEPLARLGLEVPVGVCTARALDHTYEAVAPIFTRASDPGVCQANWLLICENGGIGYFFDPDKKSYREFFRTEYPYTAQQRESFFYKLKSSLEGRIGRAKINEISFAFKPLNYETGSAQEIAAGCNEITRIVAETLEMIDAKHALAVGNSGTGVNVFPINGDKTNGIVRFAEFIGRKRGLNIGEEKREIVVVGDQPQDDGNDYAFLSGKYGTPFSVGKLHPEHILPLPVYDPASGRILSGPEATISLINQLHFRL